jgi:hypothetical protein
MARNEARIRMVIVRSIRHDFCNPPQPTSRLLIAVPASPSGICLAANPISQLQRGIISYTADATYYPERAEHACF